jgi:AcrR family transcriptional regulator
MRRKAARAVEEKRALLHRFMVEKILKGAAEIFGKAGYHGATLEEIARETGVSVGTIYQYFENKYDLYIKVLNFFMDSLMESIEEVVKGAEDPMKRLEKVLARHIEIFEENPHFFRIYLTGKHDWIIDPMDRPKAELLERYTGYIKILSDAIDELIDSRIFVSIESEKVAYYMLEMAYSAVFQRVTGYSEKTREEDIQIILNLLMNGLLSDKKIRLKVEGGEPDEKIYDFRD